MTANLVAELVKKGVPPTKVATEVSKTIGVTEKTARNKISGTTEFTVPEAVKINDVWFGGEQSLAYLFENIPETIPA